MDLVKLKSSYGALAFPKTLVFNATAGAGVTRLFINSAIGLFSELGVATGVTAQEMDIKGAVPLQSLKEYLKSYALIVQKIKYSSNVATQLDNALKTVRVGLDEQVNSSKIETATELSEMAQNDKLLTISNNPFVWDNQSGLTVETAATNEVTVAVTILAAIPYANLERFLAENGIPLAGNCK